MRVGITGHRPERLEDNEEAVKELISEALVGLKATLLYQGMAAGVDLWSAKEAWKLKIPYICVRPWAGHKPRTSDTVEYQKVMRHSVEVIDVSAFHDYTGPWLYSKRNEWIVDNSEIMIAVWDGLQSGGTYNCIKYAWSKSVPVLRIDPEDRTMEYVSETVPF